MEQLVFPFIIDAEREIASIISVRSQERVSIADVAKELGLRRSLAVAIARKVGVKYKHKRPNNRDVAAAVRAVERDGLTSRAAARAVGISRSAVSRYVVGRRKSVVNSSGGIRFEQKQEFCPIHGKLSVSPCVACAARASQ